MPLGLPSSSNALPQPLRAPAVALLVVLGLAGAAQAARRPMATAASQTPAERGPATAGSEAALDLDVEPGHAWAQLGEASAAGRRRTACDLGAHVQATTALPMDDDPVFGRATEAGREALAAVLRLVEGGADDASAAAALRPLLAGTEGPRLLREGLRVPLPRWRALLMRTGVALAAAHPRLCGFLHNDARAADPALAMAAAAFLLRSDCDSPALFGVDALRHRDAAVRRAGVDEVAAFIGRSGDLGFVAKLGAAFAAEPLPALRVRMLRALLRLQAAGAGALLAAAERDADPAVRAEALVLRTTLAGELDAASQRRLARDRAPVVRAGLARALAALGDRAARAALAGLSGDAGTFVDAVDGKRRRVGALADQLLAALNGG